MEVRIYEIEDNLQDLKKILEAKDTCEIEIKCDKCEKIENKTINANQLKEWLEKKCSCGEPLKVKVKEHKINKFARNGYTLRNANALGIDKDSYYLYISADESFFKENEDLVLIDGVKRVEGEIFERVKEEIKKESERAAEAFGGILG